MPITNVTGAQTINKAGVCTSTTRPAAPYDGQVIYETDTDRAMVYNGTGWVVLSTGTANPVGLVYITQANPNAVATVSINNCFSSTYQNYLVISNFSAAVGANTTLSFRLRASGTDATSNYSHQRLYAFGNTVGGGSNAGGTTNITAGILDATRPYSTYSTFTIGNPFASVPTTLKADTALDDTGLYSIYNYQGYNTNSTSYDGFTIYTSGTSFTGTIRVYGYLNS